jgi:Ca2+-transporting ATPase
MVGEMFPLIMLTYDPPEKGIMETPPRNPKHKILTKETMLEILFNGSIVGLVAYGAFLTEFFHNQHVAHNYEKAVTVTFTSIIFGQYANLLSRRTFGHALGQYLFSNKNLLFAFALSFSLLLLIIYIPLFNLYFHTSPLNVVDWLFPVASGVLCLFIFEYRKRMKSVNLNKALAS